MSPPDDQYPEPMRGAGETVESFAGKKLAAGICGILLGCFGVHKFILGMTVPGLIMLVVTLVSLALSPCVIPLAGWAVMQIIGIIEGILYLTKSDAEFYRLYYVERRQWF